jgi:hypothetical protein
MLACSLNRGHQWPRAIYTVRNQLPAIDGVDGCKSRGRLCAPNVRRISCIKIGVHQDRPEPIRRTLQFAVSRRVRAYWRRDPKKKPRHA